MTTMELEKFGGERLASSTPVFESIFLYWFVYFALLGFAYCTNPSDLTFRRFLTDLSIQDHLRHFTYPPSANDSATLAFDHKISINLCTPAYQRRDFFIGSLVCVSNRDAEVVEDEEDWWTSSGQWFLGAFGSWWILDRRYASDWLRSLWRRWRRQESSQTGKGDGHDQAFGIRPSSSSESPQRKASGSSKKKKRGRKKSPGHGIDASPTIIGRCTTPARADHPDLDHAEPDGLSYSSFSTGSDRDSLSSEAFSGSSPPWANRDHKEESHPAGHLSQLTTASHRVTYSCEETTGFVKLSGARAGLPILSMGRNQEMQCRKGRKTKKAHTESMVTTRTRTTMVEIAHSPYELSAEDDGSAKSAGERPRKTVEARSEVEKESGVELNAIKLKKKEEDLNKLNFPSSLKHLNEELVEFKRLDLKQKLSHVKLTHNNLVVKSQSFKKELEALHVKEGVVNLTFAQNLELVKKEKERMEIGLKKNGQEFEALSKTFEVKKAQKTALQQRLNTRKVELRVKKEPTTSPNSTSSKKSAKAGSSVRSSTPDLTTVVPSPPQSPPSISVDVTLKNEKLPDDKSPESARPISQAASPPFDDPRPLTDLNLKSDDRPPSLLDPREPNPHPDPTRNPWREEVQDELGVHFKTSLPSLDSSHSLWHPIAPPPPRSRPDFFDYRHQVLQTQVGLDQPQQTSPFGAIGQQGGSPPTVSKKFASIQTPTVFEPRALFEAFAPVSENEVHRRKLTTSLGSSTSVARPACRLERLRENQSIGGGWMAGRSVEMKGGAIGVLEAPDPFISPIGDLASFSESVRMSNRHTIGSSFPVEPRTIGLKRSTERIESRVNVRRHQTSQSVGGIGIASKGLSSVFDGVVPERSTAIKKLDQHPALSLNPSAKAFKFGGRKEESEFKETEVAEDGLLRAVKEEEEISEGGSRKKVVAKLEEEDESWTRSLAALRAGVVGPNNSTTTMTTLLSPGEALPAACTKSAWAGLFGPIGGLRSEARVDDEWGMHRERVALFNRGT